MAEPTLIREARVTYRGPRRVVHGKLTTPADAASFVSRLVGSEAREHFVTLMLDGRHRPIAYQVVSIGTATASLVHPREVFQSAVHVGAVALIVAHNHPSGDPRPSAEDRTVTTRLANAGRVLGISLLDSLVVVRGGGFHSLREEEPKIFEL
jgi:DNA repair protein RadC